MKTSPLGALTLFALTPIAVVAQADGSYRTGPREVLPAAREIALARSAAPPEVSGDATVLVWNGADFDVAVEGTGGVTCYVARSWVESLEPHCFDAEGAASILRIHIHELKLQVQGLDEAAIDREVEAALARGDLRLPSRPAMSYMMSAGQKLISDDGRPVGAWQPHIMLYYPGLDAEAMGLGATTTFMAGVVTDSGTPLSSLMVIVPEFVPVPGEGEARAP